MKIATWNVNSIRSRLSLLTQWLESRQDIDLLCLQETKVVDDQFPFSALSEIGYQAIISGQKSYNGVALISRDPVSDCSSGFSPVLGHDYAALDEQKRLMCGLYHGIRIVNVYVPNGESVGSEKYTYKLRWLEALKTYLAQWLSSPENPVLVCGDFNIAPENRDIYAPPKKDHIMASVAERKALEEILALGLQDGLRKFTSDPGYFTWWDYRAGGFQKNRGWRIDHHYLSASLYAQVKTCEIDLDPRSAEKPSDHAPVILEI
jgi:exodeoxyribonuclease-3